MKNHRPDIRKQDGDASLLITLILGLGVSGAVYYGYDKINQKQRAQSLQNQKDRAEVRNISGLSQATALMQFSGANPQADSLASLPYLYPDPYLGLSNVGATRTLPQVSTWSFSHLTLNVNSPSDKSLTAETFDNLVSLGQRAPLNNRSQIKFLSPVRDSLHPNLITGYRAEVTTQTADDREMKTRATLPVPPMPPPKCILRSPRGLKDFQPNTPMELELLVSGVSNRALVPADIAALINPWDTSSFKSIDIAQKANSIVKMNNSVYRWSVTTPRPLVAVDGTDKVKFTAYAYLQAVDNNAINNISCSFDYWVTAPATCMLWANRSSVPPGECVDITAGTMGPVQAGSLSLTATDGGGRSIGGVTKTGALSGRFCTPASEFSPEVDVSDDMAESFSDLTRGMLPIHLEAIKSSFDKFRTMLKTKLPGQAPLHNLTMSQVNGLTNLSNSQLEDLDDINLRDISGLRYLSNQQVEAIKSLEAEDINALPFSDLDAVPVLQTLSHYLRGRLSDIERSSPIHFSSYIAKTLNDMQVSLDYTIRGQVKNDEGVPASCLVHVTAGENPCPFYGARFPNHCQNLWLHINWQGNHDWQEVEFCPTAPAYEVAGIAVSPTQVTPCPADARCYGINSYGNRTPFVTVQPAKSASCEASIMLRLDLGCFAHETLIRMADGQDRPIHALKVGELVYNPLTGVNTPIKRIISGPEGQGLYRVRTAEGEVRLTAHHPMITRYQTKAAKDLAVGDELEREPGKFSPVLAIEREAEAPRLSVWNIELDTPSREDRDHAVLANGVVAGDLFLQEQLNQKPKPWSRGGTP